MNPFIAIGQADPFMDAMGPGYRPQASAGPPSLDSLFERQAKLHRLGLSDTVLGDIGNQSIDNSLKRQQMQADVQTWLGKQGKAAGDSL